MHHPRSCYYWEYNTQVFYSWKIFKVTRIYLLYFPNYWAHKTKIIHAHELQCRLGMFGGDGVSWNKKVKCSLYLRPTYVGTHILCPSSVTLCFCFCVCSYFMKAILEKKYALAHLAIDAVAAHFLRFRKETKVMPVIWHQTLLAFVQR